MAKIQFWASGFRTYYGWGTVCEYCQGHMHPQYKPDPSLGCPICFGMGGSPVRLSPQVNVGLDTYTELIRLARGRLPAAKTIKPKQLLWALAAIESGLVDHPDSLDAAWAVRDLKDVAEFAEELQTDIAHSID